MRHIVAGAAAALARGRGCPGRRSACGCAKSALLCGAGAVAAGFASASRRAEGAHAPRIGRRGALPGGGMADADFMDWPASAPFCAAQQILLPESYRLIDAPSFQQSLDRTPFQNLLSLFDSHHFVTTPHDAAGVAVTAAIGTANAVASAIAVIVVFIFSPLFWFVFGLRAAPMAAFPSHARKRGGGGSVAHRRRRRGGAGTRPEMPGAPAGAPHPHCSAAPEPPPASLMSRAGLRLRTRRSSGGVAPCGSARRGRPRRFAPWPRFAASGRCGRRADGPVIPSQAGRGHIRIAPRRRSRRRLRLCVAPG